MRFDALEFSAPEHVFTFTQKLTQDERNSCYITIAHKNGIHKTFGCINTCRNKIPAAGTIALLFILTKQERRQKGILRTKALYIEIFLEICHYASAFSLCSSAFFHGFLFV